MNIFTNFSQISAEKLPRANFDVTLKNGIAVTMAIVAVISVIFVIIGGIRYVVSSGDPQNIKRAKDTILYAVIGLVLAVSTFTVISLILSAVQ